MKKYLSIIIFLISDIILLSSGPRLHAGAHLKRVPESDTKKCMGCHMTVNAEAVPHPPTDDCENCHKSTGKDHPLTNVKGFELTQKLPELCYSCHDPKNTKKSIHPPVESGECLSCHTPHSSANKGLLLEVPVASLCKKCHDMKPEAVIHKPFADGACEKCHDPHQSDIAKLLKLDKSAVCLQCHDKQKEALNLKEVHPPFKNNCSSCHSPHSSKEAHLVSTNPPDLCFGCHDDLPDIFDKVKHKHPPLKDAKSCLNCHSPHASNEKKFLLADVKTVCLGCHNKSYTVDKKPITNIKRLLNESKNIHGAIESEGCAACHNPHGSDNYKMLVASFPSGKYMQVNKDSIALCFKCHESKLLTEQTADKNITNFRNGDKNLHFVHINGKKGRVCTICHNVHASNNDHLINDKVKFENWEMKLNYKTLEGGGSCLPGCHSEKKYTR
jgi:predicted CXXCH cytochrome family protein